MVLPDKVKARVADGRLFVEGPLGKQEISIHKLVNVATDVKQINVVRQNDLTESREVHGMFRSLVQNMVTGVAEGFKKVLDIEGIGFRAEVKGSQLSMTLGFSHPVTYDIPASIKIGVEKQTKLTITGSDRALVGQVAANIRHFRPPEPYKGKGIRYEGEVIERKVGKAAATAGGSAGGGGGGK